ncbi:AAA family ATPase [Klebsiella pneumoniae]|uniref:AAA family ATPase n=1 Tax=Klebsiella pneumoniae TaxID=573 RepID=UPI0010916348|nr:AAA family ATPase [Klebsiella pneumoniae]MBN4849890.1 AAA family ATPase [Klebsiella pneumoniae]MCP5924749.1 AAA family ATPase [Klebsiella pneumoniae]WFA37140.1 AAA family ATPase [Klebsiella pneumoniae]VGA56599.1 Predicted ATP-binding protein involved in virulence [Klebsiella pneumoniae]HBU5878713.1 AAA family ATPase [Klebsiella pneumoniae]
MKITVTGTEIHKGFLLESPVIFNNNIIVLTGKNGSGKTRFLESISNRKSIVFADDISNPLNDINYLPLNSLNINIKNNYGDGLYNQHLADAIQAFDIVKPTLDNRDNYFTLAHSPIIENSSVDIVSFYEMCQSASLKLNKPATDLNHDDIALHFEPSPGNFYGLQNISAIVNRYLKRKNDNDRYKWQSENRGTPSPYYTDTKFTEYFGKEPWILVNEILNDTFNGKFKINIPEYNTLNYGYKAHLILSKSNTEISTEQLSSGEKTLFWLTSILFECQYYDNTKFNTSKLLIIDEPDAYLHPKMVLQMYDTFKSYTDKFNTTIIITTHSPTSVALAPENSIYNIDNSLITQIDKDRAIADLLDGVTQISLNPKNRRQVFVESEYDANVYQSIYSKLVHRSKLIDPKISINFISSGPKVPREQLIGKVKQIFGIHDEPLLEEFANLVNGVGNCAQVKAQVEALAFESGNSTIKGIIDWDKKNTPSQHVKVFAHKYAYSIENITLDPVCILLLIHIKNPSLRTIVDMCGEDIHWSKWIKDEKLLQESVDRFILKVLGRKNNKDAKLKYISQLELETDLEYLTMNGHELEKLVINEYKDLEAFRKKRKEGELKLAIVDQSMINLTNCNFIPEVYEIIIAEVQG